MDKTLKLMDALCDTAKLLYARADDAATHYGDALYEHEALSRENYFVDPFRELADLANLADCFEETVDSAAECVEWTRDELKDFDRTLAKLIQLRGKLAEETGIPMMSHLGTGGFGRDSAQILM